MDINLNQIESFLRYFETNALYKTLEMLVEDAQLGRSARLEGFQPTPIAAPPKQLEDPSKTPQEASRYLNVSWRYLRDTLVPRYEIESYGKHKQRRFLLSELNRVRELIKQDG